MLDFKEASKFIFPIKAILLVVLLGTVSLNLYSQEREQNRPNHDDWPYYFGLSLSYNSSTLHPSKHPT
ncbi:MAG: hypothetical protein ACR2KZ_00310, partial [Segetibacter sp.]